jgi:hypothetical protein
VSAHRRTVAVAPVLKLALEQDRHWWVETCGGTAAICRSQKLCRPAEVQAWLDERLAVLRALVAD